MKNIEILSPVGSIDSFYAALNSGADAIYLAGSNYGARKAIDKFDIYEIKKMIEESHKHNVKVYVTINTLIFDDEIDELLKYTDELYLANVDAFLIQDLGLIELFSNRYKDLDLHISTQRNTRTLEEIRFYEKYKNIKRVVLARETSIDEIKEIKKNTNLEIEVFVHGAICMCYSGECLFSSLVFNRSGNRGECAQPCRLKYSLKENDNIISKDSYLLSPKELNTIEYIDELINIGVDSFKIEGRIKSSEYVSLITSIYKEKVKNKDYKISDITKEYMKRVYNRSFTKGYLFNEDSNNLVNTFRPNNLGIKLGRVLNSTKNTITIKLENKLTRLDGIRLLSADKEDIGIIVDKIYKNGIEVESANISDIVTIESYKINNKNYKDSLALVTYSKEVTNYLKDKLENNIKRSDIPLNLTIILKENDYPILIDNDTKLEVIGNNKVSKALNIPLDKSVVYNQMSKLKDTPYYLNSLNIKMDNNIFVPMGLLNNLRRELIQKLVNEKLRINRKINQIYVNKPIEQVLTNDLFIGVTNKEQFIESCDNGFKNYYVSDYNLYNELKSENPNLTIIYERERINNNYQELNNLNLSISDVGSIFKYYKNNNLFLNAYSNITNRYALKLINDYGIKKVSLSYELGMDNVYNFSDNYYKLYNTRPNLEVVLYDRCDLMITKYCAIRHQYGLNKNCNLCKKNSYSLIDRNKEEIKILKTDECGNRLLNPKILALFKFKEELEEHHITNFRINFTIENKSEVKEILTKYKMNIPFEGKKYTYGKYNK